MRPLRWLSRRPRLPQRKGPSQSSLQMTGACMVHGGKFRVRRISVQGACIRVTRCVHSVKLEVKSLARMISKEKRGRQHVERKIQYYRRGVGSLLVNCIVSSCRICFSTRRLCSNSRDITRCYHGISCLEDLSKSRAGTLYYKSAHVQSIRLHTSLYRIPNCNCFYSRLSVLVSRSKTWWQQSECVVGINGFRSMLCSDFVTPLAL